LIACSGAPTGRDAARPAPTPARPAAPATDGAALGPLQPGRQAIGKVRRESLEVTLVPIEGADAVLAVHDHAGATAAFVRRIDARGGARQEIALAGEHVLAAYERTPGSTTLVTTKKGAVCVTTYEQGDPTAGGCHAVRGHLAVPVGGKLLILSAEPPPVPEEPAVPKPKKKPKDSKRRPATPPAEKLLQSGREMTVQRTFIAPDGSSVAGPEPTGLRFDEPMAGMSLVGAAARPERTVVVFVERAKPRGKEKRAAIGVAALDLEGTFVEDSRKSFGESKLEIGFLSDHVDPRVVDAADGAVLLALRGPRGKCDVTVVAPFIMQMVPDAIDCAVDPRRFVALAQAKRKGQSASPPRAPLPDPEKARRAFGQPAWDVGRVVLTETRTFTVVDGDVVSWDTAGALERHGAAMAVDRSRIHGGAIDPSGDAIVQTESGLVLVSDGRATDLPGAFASRTSRGDRPDVAAVERRLAVRVAGAWIQAEGELAVLAPAPGPKLRALHPDTTALVGGAQRGMLIELDGGALSVSGVSPEGSTALLRRLESPIGIGFDAVIRASGGAIVAGPARGARGNAIAFAIDAEGNASKPREIDLPASARVRLSSLPGGGALVTDERRRHVVWLDDGAAPLAAAAWPAKTNGASCIDGNPARFEVPSRTPGHFVAFPAAESPGTCVTEWLWTEDALRWLGSTAKAGHSRAEIGSAPLPPGERAASGSGATTVAAPRAAPPAAVCPGDMVLVGAELCVDRFESTLLDDATGRYLSPDYAVTPALIAGALSDWSTRRERQGDLFARALPLPHLASWQREGASRPAAVARGGVIPSGYVTGTVARAACEAAGKRLCKLDEWRRACRGERGTQFPYGARYEDGACNVNVPIHPAAELHGNASLGHLDPRLNRVPDASGAPLLRTTGSSERCVSRWGDDAIYDMVGNIDEWVDEDGGAFAGGFYARSTNSGCDALVSSHPQAYLDYSTGVRCCKSAASRP
jgi:hypothetical protein